MKVYYNKWRLLNQTFFEKIYVGDIDEKLKVPDYTDLFHEIFSGEGLHKSSLVELIGRYANSYDNLSRLERSCIEALSRTT